MTADQRCPEPLNLNFAQEPVVRQYGVVLTMALRGEQGLLLQHEKYLERIFNADVSGFIIQHAIRDANDITGLPGSLNS